MKKFRDLEKQLSVNGYCIISFDNKREINKLSKMIENKISSLLKIKNFKLSKYHKYVDDEKHQNIQWEIANFFWKNKLHHKAIFGAIDFLKYIFGGDILIQKKPFLRIARPQEKKDNIGFHKDTLYGQSPYELSIHVPMVSLDKKSCLKFVPRSFLLDEKKISFIKNKANIHKRGSKKHKLGFPYNPKSIDIKNKKLDNFPFKFGEAIIFTPALIHGQEINKSNNITRFSFDTRITGLHSPINHDEKSFNGNYDIYSEGPVESLARRYLQKNK